jgi:mono/diheme cytochrome c family protein
MLRHRSVLFLIAVLLGAGGAAVGLARPGHAARAQRQQSVPSTPERLAAMRHHFVQVTLIHEAIIRGDRPAISGPAWELARMPMPPGTPPLTAPFVARIGSAAARAAGAPDLASAAAATTEMLLQCGECHRAAGILPAPSTTKRPEVGGIVGHMLEHQRAVDELLQGLVVPSLSQWRQGVERLKVAPLKPGDYPPDRALTNDLKRADARVHQIADRAARAADAPARAAVYADLLTTCAQCHGLHRRVWGPGRAPS